MEFKDLDIIAAAFGKQSNSIRYYNIREARNVTIEEGELPHPDLTNALQDFKKDLAGEFHHSTPAKVDHFVVTGFSVSDHTSKGFRINLKGKMKTASGETQGISSGNIPVEGKLEGKLGILRAEIYAYLFEGKTSQQKIPGFEGNGEENKAASVGKELADKIG